MLKVDQESYILSVNIYKIVKKKIHKGNKIYKVLK